MNLLTEPLFGIATRTGIHRVTLPGLMEMLGRDEVNHFVGIQRHQEDAFHVFLCNLAAAILARKGQSNPVQSEEFWRSGLRELAGETGDEAWTLVVPDLTKPAFMQPPLPASDHTRLKPIEPIASAPDALDLLQTAKNHDVKRARATRCDPEEWIYALISLQTMSGYSGSGNPGIARMNSGYGSRFIVELARTIRPGGRWYDAVVRLQLHRSEVLSEPFGFDPHGLVLVWIQPWDGKSSLAISDLDPSFIEICRRVRLAMEGDEIFGQVVTSDTNRIDAKELKGVVGDAWAPIELGTSDGQDKALTPQGLTPDLLRRLIFREKIKLTQLHEPLDSWEGPLTLMASVLIRGQGITEGFHERYIRIPPHVKPRLFGPLSKREPFANLAKTAIGYAGTMQWVLRTAIYTYLEGGPDQAHSIRDASQAWWRRIAFRYETLWANDYFPWLWSFSEDTKEDVALDDWVILLRKHALTAIREAERFLPRREGRKWRARVKAEEAFKRALYGKTGFPWLKEVEQERDTRKSG